LNTRDISLPSTHHYLAIFKLVHPFDHSTIT